MTSHTLLDKWNILGMVMADPELPASAKSAAYFLLNHFNTGTGQCNPSLDGLAEQMGVSRRTVVTALDQLGGYFERVKGGGRQVRTSYMPKWKTVKGGSQKDTETVNAASQNEDTETVKSGARNCEVQRTKTVKPASHEYGNRNREGIREESAPAISPPSPPPRACRLPSEWMPTPQLLSWGTERFPNLDLAGHTERFRDYYAAAPGSKGVKADWPATWRNWMRREYEDFSMKIPKAMKRGNGVMDAFAELETQTESPLRIGA